MQEVAEGDFLKVVTETQRVVVHFFHREFTRCKIMDKHLATLIHKFFGTRFVKVSAPVRHLRPCHSPRISVIHQFAPPLYACLRQCPVTAFVGKVSKRPLISSSAHCLMFCRFG